MSQTGRIRFIGICICFFSLIIVSRLYFLQAIKTEAYREQADRQYIRKGQGVFDRGSIYFSPRKRDPISAATLKSGYTVAINPRQIEYPEDIYNGLSGILNLEEETLLPLVSNPKGSYKEIARRISVEKKDRIINLDLGGVDVYSERWRDYPAGPLAANVLGLVGYGRDGTSFDGQYGLERYYNSTLSRDGSGLYVNFFAQIFSGAVNAIAGNNDEGDIITSIEPSVQIELERKLAGVMEKWGSELTGGIIMDPKTGEIFAMGVNPSFDPNNISKETDSNIFGNPIVDRVYEMGSIIKPLGVAAALDMDLVTADTTYDDTGTLVINGSRISNYDGKARGITTVQSILNQSLNIGMAFITKKLGNENLTKYFLSYGFGKETGIDLPGEVHGLVSNLNTNRDIEHVTASYGQGIALTPIETIRALSALGNGGFLPDPHIVKEITYASGKSKVLAYGGVKDQVFKKETSEEITRMLVKVFDDALLGGTVKFDHYSMAAKTGTAQMANPVDGGYYQDRYLHSFFGYFPAYNPRFIIFLYTVYPKDVQYASRTLTTPFVDMAKFLINYYEIPPDR